MNTINPKSLRIGNLIMSGNNGKFDEKGTIGKVLSIGMEECEFEQIYCECEESYEWFFKGNYFGIPLSPEILLEYGYTDENKHNFLGSFGLLLNSDRKYCLSYLSEHCLTRFEDIEFNYLHELQNAYLFYCKTELTKTPSVEKK